MKKKLFALLCVLALLVTAMCVTVSAAEENFVAEINEVGYTSLADAIADVRADDPVSTVIVLLQPVQEAVTFDRTAYLNLNGYDLGPVTVDAGCVLHCFDTETDDYMIEGDAANGYTGFGRLTVADGNEGSIVGVSAGNNFDDSYLEVTDENGISFHRVTLNIDKMTLRAKNAGESVYNPGMYYRSTFAGDQLVAENVTKFGIALSVAEEPNAQNFGVTNKCSTYTNFQPGAKGNENISSTYVKNIMKESNGRLTNTNNAQMPIYGRAYILTNEGYVFGKTVSRSLKTQMEELSKEENWNELEEDEQYVVSRMYRPYQTVMKNWSVDVIRDTFNAEEDGIIRILNISNSHGQDAVWLLPTVFATENPNCNFMIAECYFSGALTEHLANVRSDAPVYNYYTNTGEGWDAVEDVTVEYALKAEQWDYIMFNESSRHLGLESIMKQDLIGQFVDYIKGQLTYEPTLFYNMTWSNPTDDRFHDPDYADGKVRRKAVEGFKNRYTLDYGYDYVNHFNFLVEKTEQYLIDDPTFAKIMFTAAPVQYAQVRQDGGLTVPQWDDNEIWDLYRDYTHLSDFARLMVAYQIYAQFFDLEEITAVNVDVVRYQDRSTWGDRHIRLGNLEITEEHKQVIMDCVNYSLKDPLLKTLTTTPIVKNGSSKFVILHDGTEEAITLANEVRDTIAENFGVTLTVGNAATTKENSTRQEILIGDVRGIAKKTMKKLTGEFDFAVEARGNKLILCAKNALSYVYLTEYLKREVLAVTQSGDLVLMTSDSIVYSDSDLSEMNYIDYCQAGEVTVDRDDIFDFGVYTNEDTSLLYRLYVPFNYSPDKEYALMISLHGAGHRGDDNSSQLGQLMKLMNNTNAAADEVIIIAPQCPKTDKWVDTDWSKGSYSLANTPESNELKAVMELFEQVRAKYNVDDKRIYASGYSMGGYGTWNLLMNHSDIFCAAVAMCGAADPSQAANLVDIPVWAIHGVKDPTVPVSGSQEMVAAIKAAGGTKVNYTELPDHEHDVWTYTYTDAEIFAWLFNQVKA